MNEDPNAFRTRHVTEFLAERFPQADPDPFLRLDAFPPETWAGPPTGWTPPIAHEGLFVFQYCPELIALHTADLFADDADRLLSAIAGIVCLHMVHHDVPVEERIPLVEQLLHEAHAPSLDLLIGVERAFL